MAHVYRKLISGRAPFIAGLVVAATVLFGVVAGMRHASAANCTGNDIMFCGFSSRTDFINKVQANSDGHGHNDLQAIYNFYHLTSADYANFAAHAVPGEALRNGNVVVNGQVVATGTKSIGRFKSFQGSNPFTQPIAGTDYFGNTNDQAFADGVSQLAVDVLFDSSGTMQFAVMPSCGNPVFGNNVKSSAQCDMLNKTSVDGKDNTFSFTTSASANGNAKITGFTYNFGDGSPTVFQTSGSTPVEHTYGPGTFTATVTVTASVPGNSRLTLPAVAACSRQITVAQKQVPPPVVTPPVVTPPVVTPPVVTPPVVTPAVVAPAPVVVLPRTGAGNVIAPFAIVVVAGFLGHRWLLIRRRKNTS